MDAATALAPTGMSTVQDSPPSTDSEYTDGDEDASNSESENNEETVTLSPRFIEALSSSGHLYGILWPTIIEQATEKQRDECLRHVNEFFAGICLEIVRKKVTYIAKREYLSKDSYASLIRERRPVSLDLSVLNDVHWASWGAKRLDFGEVEIFREFCALGDVDPDKGYQYDTGIFPLDNEWHYALMSWVFISRTRDIIFETSLHNPNDDAYAHYFGITGRADKVERMYDYIVERKCNRKGPCTAEYLEWGMRSAI